MSIQDTAKAATWALVCNHPSCSSARGSLPQLPLTPTTILPNSTQIYFSGQNLLVTVLKGSMEKATLMWQARGRKLSDVPSHSPAEDRTATGHLYRWSSSIYSKAISFFARRQINFLPAWLTRLPGKVVCEL